MTKLRRTRSHAIPDPSPGSPPGSPPEKAPARAPAESPAKPAAKAPAKEAAKKITADSLKNLPRIEKATTTRKEASKTKAATKAQRDVLARQRKGKGRDPTPPPPPPPPPPKKPAAAKKSTTAAAASKAKSGRVTKRRRDALSVEEHRNLTNHLRSLANLIGRLRRDDDGAWTSIMPDMVRVETRLRTVLGGEFERQDLEEEEPENEEEEDEDEDPPTKRGRKPAASKKTVVPKKAAAPKKTVGPKKK